MVSDRLCSALGAGDTYHISSEVEDNVLIDVTRICS